MYESCSFLNPQPAASKQSFSFQLLKHLFPVSSKNLTQALHSISFHFIL